VEFCKAKLLSYPAQPDSSYPIYGENEQNALVKTGKNEKKQIIFYNETRGFFRNPIPFHSKRYM